MKWIETLQLMASEETINDTIRYLKTVAEELMGKENIEKIEIIKSTIYKTYLVISLYWKADQPAEKTRTGCALKEQLCKFGMVDHALWERTSTFGK